ncbi:MAG: transglycosylase SLT domain-containing protein [Thermodesulfobacteriota bacterium]
MKFFALLFILTYLFLPSKFSMAGIYRYIDERGVVHFTNCPRDPNFKLYIRESQEDVDSGDNGNQSINSVSVKDSNKFDHLIYEFSKKYEVDFALIKAMIRAESGFNPMAISRKGAKGLMQLMPQTAIRMNVSNLFDPRENIEGGVRYFKYLLSLFNNDIRLSLAAYNAGENIVSEIKAIPPYQETIDYIRRVWRYYQFYRE